MLFSHLAPCLRVSVVNRLLADQTCSPVLTYWEVDLAK